MSIKNTSDLRAMLLESIEAVKNGTMEPKQAHAIGGLSAKVIQSAKLDLDVLKFNLISESAVKAGEKVLQLVNN
jgi:hypothetical protein